MPNTNVQIHEFLRAVRNRLGIKALARAAVWSLLAASVVMLLIALYYVAQGYAVERRWYAIVAALGAAAAVVGGIVSLASPDQAARFADSFYGLHDTLVSWLHFSRRQKISGFYALQAEQTATMVHELDARRIDWRPARAPTLFAILLAGTAIALAWKQPSSAVEQRLALESAVAEQTETINEELKDLVEQLKQSTSDDERELLQPDQLREMVEQLATTRDQKEALRQYARLENTLNETKAKLEQRHDEHLMQAAARELESARETKPLADKLSQKKYDEAAAELEQSQPDAKKPLSEQQKELAKLRAAGQRMAAAAKSAGRAGSSAADASSQSKSAKSGSSAKGASGSASGANSSGGGGDLENSIQEFDQAIEDWDQALSEAARQEKADGKCDAEAAANCQACRQNAGEKLNKLSKNLKKMAVKRLAGDKLCKLCQACSECQTSLCQCQGQKPGGKNAGSGTVASRREEQSEMVDNGQTQALQGIKGEGPSQSTIEAADDGSGVARRAGPAPTRNYRRQFESFVSREDVPEQVKSGVRNYFESIHKIEEQK